jgi:hypothetical protein
LTVSTTYVRRWSLRRVEAAQIGGDALILGPESTKSTFLILSPFLIKSDRKELTAEVIVFNRPSRREA